jgi:Chitobiase/beta-hexosaminidase C-terminal domain
MDRRQFHKGALSTAIAGILQTPAWARNPRGYPVGPLTAATPTFLPPAGTYTGSQTVAISSTTPSNTIHFTVNGTTPTTSSPVYTGPITVSASETVRAISIASGYLQSTVGSATYTITVAGIYEGGNFGGVGSTEQPYLNLLNSGQGPANLTGWSNSGSTTYPQILAVLDANGYPTSLPGGNAITTFLDASLNDQDPLSANGSGIGNGPPPGCTQLYPSGDHTRGFAGDYTLTFQGACTLTLGRDATSGSLATSSANVSVSGLTITSTMTSGQTGVVTFNVNSPSTAGLTLNITALPSGTNYFRNASVVRSSQVANYNAGARFDPNWIASVTNNGAGGYKRLRFMDDLVMAGSYSNTCFGNIYLAQVPALTTGSSLTQTMTTAWNAPSRTYTCVLGTNNGSDLAQNNTVTLTYQSTTAVFGSAFTGPVTAGATNLWIQAFEGWSTRNVPTNVFWGNANGNGTPGMIPYETAIAMCNATNCDVWLNVPLWANSFTGKQAFWTSLAQLVQSNLNPGLKCYLEIGNEIFIEADEPYCNMLAFTMFGVGDFTSFLGLQYALMSQAFQAVFGSSFASTIMIGPTTEFSTGNGVSFLEGQMNGVSINGGVYPNSFLAAKPYTYFTHWSVAPYWGSLSSADAVTMMGTTTPLDDFFACLYSNVGTTANGSHTYASASATVPAGGATVTGWLNIVTAVIANMKSQIASQPWANYPVHCYESGPGFSTDGYSNAANSYTGPYGGGTYTTIRSAGTAFVISANRDVRMGYALYDPTHQLSSNPGFLPAAVAAGVTTMNYYDNCRSESASGPWGALSNVMSLPSSGGTGTAASFPKYAAIMNWIEGIVPTTFHYFISPTGSDSNVGSLASPWSITAINTKQSTYAGSSVGIMPGTYDVSVLMQNAGYEGAVLQIQGGPNSSTPTTIGTCNSSGVYQAGTATLDAYGSVGAYGGGNTTHYPYVIGQTVGSTGTGPQPSNVGNFILKGLTIWRFNAWAVAVGGGVDTLPSQPQNITLQDLTLWGGVTGITGTHPGAIMLYDYNNVTVTNCMVYDNISTATADPTHNGASITGEGFGGGSSGLLVQLCTVIESPGFYLFQDNGNVSDTIIEQCYFDMTTTTGVSQTTAFAGGTNSVTGQTGNIFRNNIIRGGGCADNVGLYASYNGSPFLFYNNTWDRQGGSGGNQLGFRCLEASGSSALVSAYNNLFYDNGSGSLGGYGYMAANVDGFTVCDYNIYGTLNQFSTYASGGTSSTSRTFSTWQTAIGGKDAHSSTNSTNPFTNNGAYALQYQISSGSVAYQTGKVGGVSSGAAVNVGAWDGIVTQIGSTLPVP